MDDLVSDEATGRGAVFRQSQRQRAQGVERGAGFGVRRLAVSQEGVKADGQGHRCQRPGPASTHGIRHGHPHRGCLAEPVLLEVGDELLKILDGDPPGGAAARQAREVGRVQAQLHHARLHARGHVARADGVGGDRQAANGRLHALVRPVS